MARRARVVDLGPDGPLGLELEVGLFVDYDDRQEAKDLGGYRWDAERKCWRFAASRRAECQRLANALNARNGHTVTAEERAAAGRQQRSKQPPPRRPMPGQPRDLAAAIAAMFALLPATTHRSVLANLRRALHPDTGGDTAAMQALNEATKELRL